MSLCIVKGIEFKDKILHISNWVNNKMNEIAKNIGFESIKECVTKRCRGASRIYLLNERSPEIFDISCRKAAFSRDSFASSIPNTMYRETRGTDAGSLAYRKRGGSRAYKQEGERGISLNRTIIDLRWYLVNTGGDVRS